MLIYQKLKHLSKKGKKIRVALVGAGAMGVGIAYQIARTPGMELVCISDIDLNAAQKAARATQAKAIKVVQKNDRLPANHLLLSRDPSFLIEQAHALQLDVMVEATNTIGFAAQISMQAIEQKLHVVLMNAEVDLALGPLLNRMAEENGVVITSDAGDQHGVLARMIDEIQMWDFRIVMAGNIKGFLNRYATADTLLHEARIRNLNPLQCAAYTDGTKLCIEMAAIANGVGLVPFVPGMEGPRAGHVRDVFHLFNFEKYQDTGVIDYILGAQPGGGVFVIGHCDHPVQVPYLKYYKLGQGPYYLFYRPYHLCHLETPYAIANAVLNHQAVLSPVHGRITDVFAYAKRDMEPGEVIKHGIGGDHFYGLVEMTQPAEAMNQVPITLLEAEDTKQPVVTRKIERDQPLTRADIALPDTFLTRQFRRQMDATLTMKHAS